MADRGAGELEPRGPRGSESWYAGDLGVGGSAVVDAEVARGVVGKGVEAGEVTGAVNAPAPGFAFEGTEAPKGEAFPETLVNIALVDSGFGRGAKFA